MIHKRWYCQTSNIKHTKSQNLNVSHLILQLSFSNLLQPGVKSRMKMWSEQRQQAMLQLHLSGQQFYCLLRRALYSRFGNIFYNLPILHTKHQHCTLLMIGALWSQKKPKTVNTGQVDISHWHPLLGFFVLVPYLWSKVHEVNATHVRIR